MMNSKARGRAAYTRPREHAKNLAKRLGSL